MEIIPPVRVTRFQQLEIGELFVFTHDNGACLALKMQPQPNQDRNSLVLLGPNFPSGFGESFILDWQPATVISYGKNFSVLLPTDPTDWIMSGNRRIPVCIAVCGQSVWVCTNGGMSPENFFQCYVELSTGKLAQNGLPDYAAYTNKWEIVLPGAQTSSRPLLKYPLEGAEA